MMENNDYESAVMHWMIDDEELDLLERDARLAPNDLALYHIGDDQQKLPACRFLDRQSGCVVSGDRQRC